MWLPVDLLTDHDVRQLPDKLGRGVQWARRVEAEAPYSSGEMEYTILDLSVAGSLSGGLFKADAKYRRILTVSSLVIFREISEQGLIARFGASIRLVVGVTQKEGSFELSLPAIAAAAELGMAEAFYRVAWSGLNLEKVGASLAKIKQGPSPLSVENLHALTAALDEVKEAILTTTGAVTGSPLSLHVDDSELDRLSNEAAVARTYALSAIADGHSRDDSELEFEGSRPPWAEVALDMHSALTGAAANEPPDDELVRRTREVLQRFRLKRR